ncbi:putative ribonuclease H-like domain-containing protein [Tanacetum coccineum]
MSNITNTYPIPSIPNIRIHKDHSLDHVIGDVQSGVLSRRVTQKDVHNEQGFISEEPKKVYRNKKDERDIVIRNKERLVAQGCTQEEGIDYDEVFTLVARIEAISSLKDDEIFISQRQIDFMEYAECIPIVANSTTEAEYVAAAIKNPMFHSKTKHIEIRHHFIRDSNEKKLIQMIKIHTDQNVADLLSKAFNVGKFQYIYCKYRMLYPLKVFIEGGLKIQSFLTEFIRVKGDILLVQVYVDDIIFGSTRKKMCTEFKKMMHKKFQMSSIGELTFFLGLQVIQKDDGIFISQDKSMIRSLMYLTASRPDIMFVVCACARFQVTPKVSHLYAVKRIFIYLKGQPKLGLWYPKDSPFDLKAYTDSDYAGASLDRKSTIGGCQFLGSRLISWQCKKQTIVANSTTEAEYVAASSCCRQTKHIEIRHHFIRYSNEKKLIQMIKIHTDQNVVDLLTKAFNVGRFQYLIASIGMLNL